MNLRLVVENYMKVWFTDGIFGPSLTLRLVRILGLHRLPRLQTARPAPRCDPLRACSMPSLRRLHHRTRSSPAGQGCH